MTNHELKLSALHMARDINGGKQQTAEKVLAAAEEIYSWLKKK